MCNYGSYVFNEGKLEGILKLIINKMKKKNISAVDAMIEMDIDEKDFNLYLDKIYKILNK